MNKFFKKRWKKLHPIIVIGVTFSGGTASAFNYLQGANPGISLAPDTPPEIAEQVLRKMFPDLHSLSPPQFNINIHWDPASTATGDGGANQGDALTLTWSIIPDGTPMPAAGFWDTTCRSNLIAKFDIIYGAGNWQTEVANVFNEWASLTGNHYVKEPNDDGAIWPSTPGVIGKRGDIRIGGCKVDRNSGILAYNYFPHIGDMKIDATDSFYATANLTGKIHNIFSHEHGHGAGISHVCPVNRTKLMEPIITTAFIGPQHDDIRAIQRHYGDYNELIGNPNDSVAAATVLNIQPNDTAEMLDVSIDGNNDEDWYRFEVGGGRNVSVTVQPVGFEYADADLVGGRCQSGPIIDSSKIHDLGFEIIDSDGTTVRDTVNNGTTAFVSLGSAGTKYIRVFGDGTDDIQLYDLKMKIGDELSVNLSSFTVNAINGQTALELTTGTEKDNAGFYVWRGQPLDGKCSDNPNNYTDVQTITPLVASQGTDVSGATYTITDRHVVSGNTYCYALEDIDFSGNSTFHMDKIISVTP